MRWAVPPVFCLPLAFAGKTHLTATLSPPKGGEGASFAAGGAV